MVELSHRERVARVLAHEEPDRVPLDLMGHASLILDDMYFRLRDHLGIQGDIPPFREGSTANYYDERILRRFDIDFRRLMLPTTRAARIQHRPDGSFTNYWGITYARTGAFVNVVVDPPLSLFSTPQDVGMLRPPTTIYCVEHLYDWLATPVSCGHVADNHNGLYENLRSMSKAGLA